jgi:nucleotide-binding universal stress UspA family protein
VLVVTEGAEAGEGVDAGPGADDAFASIVCGVDGSDDGMLALRQALALRSDDGRVVAVTVRHLAGAIHAGHEAALAAEQLEHDADAAVERAREALRDVPGAETRLVEGRPVESLLEAANDVRATLLAIGTPPGGRLEGIMLGHVATTLLHEAPCPVLVGRREWPDGAPGSVVAGFDGSDEALRALAIARLLGERLGATVRVLAAKGGKGLDEAQLAAIPELELDDRAPADALVEASEQADLLVVGSRGTHGLRALGSVSERVAHRAASSVLVVRRLAYART